MDRNIITLAINIDKIDMLSSEKITDKIGKEAIKELKKNFGNDYNTWYNVTTLNIKKEQSCLFDGILVYVQLEVSLSEEMIEIMKEVEERLKVGL